MSEWHSDGSMIITRGLSRQQNSPNSSQDWGGNEMKEYRNEVQAVADMYGKDFKETLQAANSLSKQFGITSQEAMNIIKMVLWPVQM